MKLKIISDGTNAGTHLIDQETGQKVEGVSKLTWDANCKKFSTTTNVELLNIPVEIVSSAQIDLFEWTEANCEMIDEIGTDGHIDAAGTSYNLIHTKTFQKDIKIVSEGHSHETRIFDKETGLPVGAIQEIEWEATPAKQGATINKIFFDKKSWV